MIVRECCKGDDEIYGKGKNLTTATQKPPKRWSLKFVWMTNSVISTTMQNCIQIGLSVSLLRMHDFAPLAESDSAIFWLLRKATAETRVPILTQNIRQTTQFRLRKCLLGVAKPISKVYTPIFPQTVIFGPHFDGTFFRPKTALTLDGSRVNDP